ncbi:MAG: response regulator transcription factor [Gammaproteobacteria bacterium]|nr:response regulator transcription factor [Gammaproteobacteria bacterium]
MTRAPTVLVVEDDLKLRALLNRRFEAEGIDVLTAAGMVDARGILRAVTPVAAVVDVGLEDSNGLELVADLAADMLVVVITGTRDLELLRQAMALGAADVVFKPFDDRELAIRVLARLGRNAPRAGVRGAAVCLERAEGRNLVCTREGREERLSMREDQTLSMLLERQGRVVSRDELSRAIYDEPWDPASRRVDALIARLRGKLHCDSCGVQRNLTTVHNAGYRFDGSIPDRH